MISPRSPPVYFWILAMSCVSFNLSKYFSIIKHHHTFRENIIINVWIIFSCQPCGESISEYLVDVNLVKIWGNYPSFTLSYWGSVYHPLLLSFDPQTPSVSACDGRTDGSSNLALRMLVQSPGQWDDLVIISDIPVLICPGSPLIIQHNHRPSPWYTMIHIVIHHSLVWTNYTFSHGPTEYYCGLDIDDQTTITYRKD